MLVEDTARPMPSYFEGPARRTSGRSEKREDMKKPPRVEATRGFSGSDRRRSGDLTIFSRTLYQLSYRARHVPGGNLR